ncbi:unnamed protein product [Cyclocybe aegerita]|uniref:Uncharacterized protein n=1 Tax=Cyclocybe aegerita TaxID=1973307 RepID=A0A8S0WJQ4_CYCAE|nr:unnamed protein product [Cyclocybe aegerita]
MSGGGRRSTSGHDSGEDELETTSNGARHTPTRNQEGHTAKMQFASADIEGNSGYWFAVDVRGDDSEEWPRQPVFFDVDFYLQKYQG